MAKCKSVKGKMSHPPPKLREPHPLTSKGLSVANFCYKSEEKKHIIISQVGKKDPKTIRLWCDLRTYMGNVTNSLLNDLYCD